MKLIFNKEKELLINFLKKENFQIKENSTNGITIKASKDKIHMNWFQSTGNIQFQGKLNDSDKKDIELKIKNLSENNNSDNTTTMPNIKNDKVFIVHGHDKIALLELKDLLRDLKLNVVISQNKTTRGLSILDGVLEDISSVSFAFDLLTPDDKGYSNLDGESKTLPRARQNVIFEMGMLYGKLPKNKIMILNKNDVELPSDINGMIYKSFKNDIKEIRYDIETELKEAGVI
ncbi:predicted coding region [Mycoplasmopsis pulmonis]|uniref:CD-NTase-associated protein 12/Pycsar effector protein TIR domain-containing protein n=1 Tax=Mycoplasmopsis pulmonis (strain UAB CTIP) TaxID=272635 RepID=Q98RD6_MYCPU|nr:TIR domain-containing protein [Mycoplasmopsis pulmonis]CAC13246.1 predicted coding region [Mycoplasmopsis pulmonis]